MTVLRPVPKPEMPPRDPDYRDWIRSLPCLIRGHRGSPIDCAHTDGGGALGRKGSDYLTVPLSHDLHMELHRGEKTFEAKYGVDLRREAAALRRVYLLERG